LIVWTFKQWRKPFLRRDLDAANVILSCFMAEIIPWMLANLLEFQRAGCRIVSKSLRMINTAEKFLTVMIFA
jgi:hypothetical protein